MKIYTKTGDKGKTGLFNGRRVDKFDLRVECYGTIDELNSIIGIARTFCNSEDLCKDLLNISALLFDLGADLATPIDFESEFNPRRIDEPDIEKLEKLIDSYTEKIPKLNSFILPGGVPSAAFLHQARTICRRAERRIVLLAKEQEIGNSIIIFVNRLSDYLFTASRYANFSEGKDDIIWNKELSYK